MTTKPKGPLTEPAPGDTPGEVEPDDARPKPISLHGMTAEAVLLLLRALRTKGEPVLIEAPEGRPVDAVVVEGHAYTGEWYTREIWWFHPKSLDMACRVAGWRKVARGGGTWRLS